MAWYLIKHKDNFSFTFCLINCVIRDRNYLFLHTCSYFPFAVKECFIYVGTHHKCDGDDEITVIYILILVLGIHSKSGRTSLV
jgi:hypothetical protein